MDLKEQIEQWLQPILEERKLFLVDVHVLGKSKVEVFLDCEEHIQINQCAEVSRILEKLLDGSGMVAENYILDVSSPGMTSPLKVPRQYQNRIHQTLEIIKTDGSIFEAELLAADEQKIQLKKPSPLKNLSKTKAKKMGEVKEEAPFELPYSEIKKATVQFNW